MSTVAYDLQELNLSDALSERYLAYALSTITSRSLPDVRDGLKPVHRRLLFAMRELKLNPDTGYKKCARIVGDVMGKYHPHGDSAIYDAMVRLAQEFSVRFPLVDGQGNFGNIDGDNAAAMRYTEARMTTVAKLMLEAIDENAVDFRDTYDGEGAEPVVLPANFPNLLANGASGIAVGMATNIPPHNVAEICDGLLHLIKFPNAGIDKLVDLIPGPDFPTGGIVCEDRETIIETYRTGRGAFRMRAKWNVEKLKSGTWQIVITEIPYQVQKSRLIERIADLIAERKIPMLQDIIDESAEDIRIVLEPKTRNVDADLLMEMLFKNTDLESRFNLNMNVLSEQGRLPKVLDLRAVLQEFLNHRHDVLQRRSQFRIDKITRRLEILDGLLVCFLNLDDIIAIIRGDDDPKNTIMQKYSLTEIQADAILNMRLRSLRRLEEMEIKTEHESLSQELADLRTLMTDEGLRWGKIADEIKSLKSQFAKTTDLGARRTEITSAPKSVAVPTEAMIEREPITVILSDKGWVRSMKGHTKSNTDISYKDGDSERFVSHAQTTDKILILSDTGRVYTLGADKLPGGRGHGEPVRLMIDLPNDENIVHMTIHNPVGKLLMVASDGRGFIVPEQDIVAQTKNGKQVLNVTAPTVAQICTPVVGDHVAVIGQNRKLLVFPTAEIPEMTRGKGVKLQNYRDGGIADAKTFNGATGLSWSLGDRTRTETDLRPWQGKRASAGKMPPAGFPRDNLFGLVDEPATAITPETVQNETAQPTQFNAGQGDLMESTAKNIGESTGTIPPNTPKIHNDPILNEMAQNQAKQENATTGQKPPSLLDPKPDDQ